MTKIVLAIVCLLTGCATLYQTPVYNIPIQRPFGATNLQTKEEVDAITTIVIEEFSRAHKINQGVLRTALKKNKPTIFVRSSKKNTCSSGEQISPGCTYLDRHKHIDIEINWINGRCTGQRQLVHHLFHFFHQRIYNNLDQTHSDLRSWGAATSGERSAQMDVMSRVCFKPLKRKKNQQWINSGTSNW